MTNNLKLVAVLLVGSLGLVLGQDASMVQTKAGQVTGLMESIGTSKVHWYQGIRFGHAGRFEKPKPAEPWTGVFKATAHPNACPQFDGSTGPHANQGEDCLFLNVWRPAEAKANRTVMVWIYGGGWTVGSISQGFDSRHLAHDGDVVVVLLNYRLGPLGFLYAGTDGADGNYALHDQILGLEWVRDNIAAFGGNPADVTIFGESAGSMSVGALILSPLAKGLFHRAIMQSGTVTNVIDSLAVGKQHAESFAKQVNCATGAGMVKCLREKPLDQIRAAHLTINRPVYGETLLPTQPETALKDNKFNQNLDVLYGVCDNEPDFMFICPTIHFVEEIARHATAAQHFYSYRLMENPNSKTSVPHGTDVQYLFDLQLRGANQLSVDMIRAWTTFAKTGKAGAMGAVEWAEAFTDKANPATQFMALNSANYHMVKDLYKGQCH